MPSYEASTVTRAEPEAAWRVWTDVATWTAHDHVESAAIDREFGVGARITSRAVGFPASTLTVTRAEPPRLWADESRSPGVRMTFEHVIEPVAEGTRLTERVRIAGPLGVVLAPLMRRRLLALFEAAVASVASDAEATSQQPGVG